MFFFTDLEKLVYQNSTQAFGPLAGNENHQFLVTNKFTVQSGALAYMPMRGTLCIQPANNDPNSSRVNIAIKVRAPIKNGYTPVDYIIYRGIRKDSILTASLDFLPAGATDLTTHLWQAWQDAQNKPGHITSTGPVPFDVGWQVVGASNLNKDLLLDDFFGKNAFGLQLPTLAEGACIGTFDSQGEISIDVILKDDVLAPTLPLLYRETNILSIPQSAYSVDNQTYAVKRKREELLAYLELGALYALSALEGVDCVYNGNIYSVKGVEKVHNTYLQFFYHQNTVFLDIRNENSLSLNHYNEYKNEAEDATTTPLFYLSTDATHLAATTPFLPRWPWPLYLVYPQASSALSLAFSTARNPDPMVYLEFSTLSKSFEKRYGRQVSFISLTPVNGKSSPLELALPVVKDAVSNQQVTSCTLCKLMVVRRTIPDYSTGNANTGSGPVRKTYLDNLFGPIADLTGRRPQRFFAKRWISLNAPGNLAITGAIVQPSRVYTDEHVIFQAQVLDAYSSTTAGLSDAASLLAFGKRIQTIPVEQVYGPDPIDSNQEAAALGTELRRIVLSTDSAPALPLLAWAASTNPLSLHLTRSEYEALVAIAETNFDQTLEDVYCFFSPFIHEKTIDEIRPRTIVSGVIYLGGITRGGLYVNMDETLMPLNQRVYSLDGRHFNSLASGQTTTIILPPEPQEEYASADFIADIKTIEHVYAASDLRLDQTVTRVRVHQYGFTNEDIAPPAATTVNEDDNIFERAWARTKDTTKQIIADYTQGGPGTVFNLNIPTSDYWESDPAHPSALPCTLGSLEIVPYSKADTETDGCRVRQLYASDGLSATLIHRVGRKRFGLEKKLPLVNKRIRNSTAMVDPGHNIIDLGHTLYTLDALFTAPDIAQRGSSRRPSLGFIEMGVMDGVYLANYIGDITGTLAVSYNLYYNTDEQPHKSFTERYSIREYIEQQYAITSPLPDLTSDADGFALYAVWANIFHKKPATKLSDVLAYYYSNEVANDKEYTYKNRWKLFCLAAGFVQQHGSQYQWEPNEATLRVAMRAGYQFGYLAEAHGKELGEFVLSGGNGGIGVFNLASYANLRRLTHDVTDDDLTFVMRKFLTQVKGLLQNEQANSNWAITY